MVATRWCRGAERREEWRCWLTLPGEGDAIHKAECVTTAELNSYVMPTKLKFSSIREFCVCCW